jgi:biopolymer transport protein TolR
VPKQALVAAPLAGLFLILAVVAFVCLATPQGLMVELADRMEGADCIPFRDIVISVANDGSLRINKDPVELVSLQGRLHEIFETRNQRLVFVMADSDVAFQKVAETIESAQREVEYVALLTPAVQKETGCLIASRPVPIKPQTHVDLPPWMHPVPLWPW